MTSKTKVTTVNIHGKEYIPVSERVRVAHEEGKFDKLYTEVLCNDPVVIRATVTLNGKEYTGISSVSLQAFKQIEKQNPYEVAETSAVGRALGFAGYGIESGIASADELQKPVAAPRSTPQVQDDGYIHEPVEEAAGSPTISYASMSRTMLMTQVSSLMSRGKIKKDFVYLNKATREELIEALQKAA